MSERLARYSTIVHPANLNSDYGIPVIVLAADKNAAVSRAIDVGWSGRRSDARVTVRSVEDVVPADEGVSGVE